MIALAAAKKLLKEQEAKDLALGYNKKSMKIIREG